MKNVITLVGSLLAIGAVAVVVNIQLERIAKESSGYNYELERTVKLEEQRKAWMNTQVEYPSQ